MQYICKGVYFARDSSYSHRNTSLDGNGYCYIYLTRVLTGEYTVGNRSMVTPPAKNAKINQHVLFDSTVNNVGNPTIFVVYTDYQNYPAYLITYTNRNIPQGIELLLLNIVNKSNGNTKLNYVNKVEVIILCKN